MVNIFWPDSYPKMPFIIHTRWSDGTDSKEDFDDWRSARESCNKKIGSMKLDTARHVLNFQVERHYWTITYLMKNSTLVELEYDSLQEVGVRVDGITVMMDRLVHFTCKLQVEVIMKTDTDFYAFRIVNRLDAKSPDTLVASGGIRTPLTGTPSTIQLSQTTPSAIQIPAV